jgi:hypothetical protein
VYAPLERVELADHHGGHAAAGLTDLLVGALDDPLVADRGGEQPDLAGLVAMDLGRRPLGGDLARRQARAAAGSGGGSDTLAIVAIVLAALALIAAGANLALRRQAGDRRA